MIQRALQGKVMSNESGKQLKIEKTFIFAQVKDDF